MWCHLKRIFHYEVLSKSYNGSSVSNTASTQSSQGEQNKIIPVIGCHLLGDGVLAQCSRVWQAFADSRISDPDTPVSIPSLEVCFSRQRIACLFLQLLCLAASFLSIHSPVLSAKVILRPRSMFFLLSKSRLHSSGTQRGCPPQPHLSSLLSSCKLISSPLHRPKTHKSPERLCRNASVITVLVR